MEAVLVIYPLFAAGSLEPGTDALAARGNQRAAKRETMTTWDACRRSTGRAQAPLTDVVNRTPA